jgi:hypothetical protein
MNARISHFIFVVNVHVDELSSARIWQHKLCATLSANVNINYRLPIKVYYRICTLRHILVEALGTDHLTFKPENIFHTEQKSDDNFFT